MSAVLKSRLPLIAAELRPRMGAAVEEIAQGIAVQAKQRVPVDEGTLRDAIHTERAGPASTYVVAGDTEAFYGHMIEFGTSHSAPRPFLVPAFEEGRQLAAEIATAALRSL